MDFGFLAGWFFHFFKTSHKNEERHEMKITSWEVESMKHDLATETRARICRDDEAASRRTGWRAVKRANQLKQLRCAKLMDVVK